MPKKQSQPTPYPEIDQDFVDRVEGRLVGAGPAADPILAAITAVVETLLEAPPLTLLALGDRFTPVTVDWTEPGKPVVTIINDAATVKHGDKTLHEPPTPKPVPTRGDPRAPSKPPA